MINRYAGKCRWCGKTVQPRTGNVMGEQGAWEFSHNGCIPGMKRPAKKPVLEYDL